MESFVRIVLCLTVVAALTVGVAYAQPTWAVDLGLDFWNVLELDRNLAKSEHFGEWLDEKRHDMLERAEQKSKVVAQLIQRKITLAEATAQVLRICDDETLQIGCKGLSIAAKTRQERACRLLLYWADENLIDQPKQAAAVHAQLEKEMQQVVTGVN